MAKINLLPWRDELREQRKKQFITICIAVALLAIAAVLATWFYLDQKLNDQEQANQLVVSTNQNLDTQLKSLDGLQERRNTVIELVRIMPTTVYVTKFTRAGDKFTIEGKAESPNAVAELLRGLEASPWYRNAFMNSFLAAAENKEKAATSVVPRVEESYGTFIVTADLGEIALPAQDNSENKGAAQ